MRRAPDLESLRLLTLVARFGSLGAAAAELGIAQPSASKRMSTLERRLGLVLLDRSRRGSQLTDAGRAVAGWAERVLGDVDELLDGAEALRANRDGELRVAASLTVADFFAPAWIGELRRREPGLYVGLQVANSQQVAELVRSEAAQIGFIESPRTPRGLAGRTVAHDELVVVVAPGHPWARKRRALTPAELAGTPLLVREAGSGTRETLEAALSRAGAAPVHPLLELGSTAAIRGAVMAGTGPAVISEVAIRADIEAGRLAAVSLHGVTLRRALRAVWPAGRTLTGPAAALLAVAITTGSLGSGAVEGLRAAAGPVNEVAAGDTVPVAELQELLLVEFLRQVTRRLVRLLEVPEPSQRVHQPLSAVRHGYHPSHPKTAQGTEPNSRLRAKDVLPTVEGFYRIPVNC
jgi:DNA-binding transcriptional LysR family regulator